MSRPQGAITTTLARRRSCTAGGAIWSLPTPVPTPFTFQFEPIPGSAGREFRFSIEFEPAPGSLLTLYRSWEPVYPAGPYTENGHPGQGTVAFRAFCFVKYRCVEVNRPRDESPV